MAYQTPSPSPNSDQGGSRAAFDALAAALAAGGAQTASSDQRIPWQISGVTPGQDANDRRSGGVMGTHEVKLTADEATARFYAMSGDERRQLGASLYKAGQISNPLDFSQVFSAWQSAVKMADNAAVAGSPMTPWDAINMMLTFGAGASGTGGRSRPATTTSTNITIPSPSDAESLIKTIFQQEMGKNPTDQQLAKYTSLVVGAAQKGTTTTSTHKYDAQGNELSQTNVSQGGPNYQQIVTDAVQQDPEYGAYQAATTYYNAMLKAIGSPV